MSAARVGVLTVSDSCSRGDADDRSGPNLCSLICSAVELQFSTSEIVSRCVPDKIEAIQEVLLAWTDELCLKLILTTGGTGFSPRDVTPEATKPLLDKEAPGVAVAMTTKSLAVTPLAMLSRSVCGIRKSTLIVNLPGSKKASEECFNFILPVLPHALDLLSGSPKVKQTHAVMQTRASKHTCSSTSSQHSCSHGHHTAPPPGKRSRESFYPVAHRPRQSPYPMISVEEALSVVLQKTPLASKAIMLPLKDALHHVLAHEIKAPQAHPPFAASIKDGYAVISSDGGGERKVLAPIAAGDYPSEGVVSGSVARITTGAPMPPGADAVVQVEDTELVESSEDGSVEKVVRILSSVQPGHDVRPVGSDISEGETVLEAGVRLGPAEIGLTASVGASQVTAFPLPTVAVLSTGNELVEPGMVSHLAPGKVYDSNRHTIVAALAQHHFKGLDLGIAQDTRESLVKLITKAFNEADVLITTGGVSMGEKDLLKPVLVEDFEATVHFGRVFMKPGKPTTFATAKWNNKVKLVFALPGNPVSAAVTFHLFVLPSLRKLAGWKKVENTTVTAKLAGTIVLDPRPEFHRAFLTWSPPEPLPTASSTGSQMSSRLLSMKSVNALLVLPPRTQEQTQLTAGSTVTAMLLAPVQ